MIKFIFPILILLIIILLFKKNKLDPDVTGLLLISLAIFLLLSNNTYFLFLLADLLSINYVPLSILAVAIGLLFSLSICFAVLLYDTRKRQIELLVKLAQIEVKNKI